MKINIPKPCSQDWQAMEERSGGRFCAHCEKTVVDFSHMSDSELLNFFAKNPSTHCGRFYNSQLNREIEYVIPRKNIFFRFNKVAAAVFAVLSFKSVSSKDHNRPQNATTVFDANALKKTCSHEGDVIISGRIKDTHGKPIENSEVLIDTFVVATSDENGYFEFVLKFTDCEIEEIEAEFFTLFFMYPGMVTQVRTYHRVMKSTRFDVALYRQGDNSGYGFRGGVIDVEEVSLGDLPSIVFKGNSWKLTKDAKSLLKVIAQKLRQNPGTRISVVAYRVGNRPEAPQKKKSDNVKNYLVEQEGISPDRIVNSVQAGCELNYVDITQIEN